MRITCDAAADAVCVCLTGQPLTPGRATVQAGTPSDIGGFVALDREDGRLAGTGVPGAARRLHPGLLEGAEAAG